MPPGCVAWGKLSWVPAYPQPPTPHLFGCVSALEEPSIRLWGGGQLAVCPGWGWGGQDGASPGRAVSERCVG